MRAALRYVSTEDSKPVARDLKKIYQAATVVEAEAALEEFAQEWDEKYPTIAKMWRAKWHDIATLFDFPPAIRKAIYTTNAIESVNSVIRKFTRNRKIYPNEESAIKLVYMAISEASKNGPSRSTTGSRRSTTSPLCMKSDYQRSTSKRRAHAGVTQKTLQAHRHGDTASCVIPHFL